MRERGLKSVCCPAQRSLRCRSREGARIEIKLSDNPTNTIFVAPARERGLKSDSCPQKPLIQRRSRKGAWIEMRARLMPMTDFKVAPARERGLKCHLVQIVQIVAAGLSREGAWI